MAKFTPELYRMPAAQIADRIGRNQRRVVASHRQSRGAAKVERTRNIDLRQADRQGHAVIYPKRRRVHLVRGCRGERDPVKSESCFVQQLRLKKMDLVERQHLPQTFAYVAKTRNCRSQQRRLGPECVLVDV